MSDNKIEEKKEDKHWLWKPGQSGNIEGSRATSRQRRWMEEVIGTRNRTMLEVAVGMALEGDRVILQFLLSRYLPPNMTVEMYELKMLKEKTSAGKVDSLLMSVASGDMATEDAITITQLLKNVSELKILDDIEQRLARLEASTASIPGEVIKSTVSGE